MTIIDISPFQLVICLLFVVLAGIASIVMKLKLEKDLVWGTIRMFAQLYLVGYLITLVFEVNNVFVVLLLYVWMIFWAAHAIRNRVDEKTIPMFMPIFVSMVISYLIVSYLVTGIVIQVKPWYNPRYFIPLGGMIIGNSMNAIAIALDRMFADLRNRRSEIELAFCLGATYQEATEEIMRSVIKAGMIPSINALMTVGLVSLPGMMTGQILAGADPVLAVKYQIIVMLMLVGSTTLGCIVVVQIVRRLCFNSNHQMTLNLKI